MPAAACLGPFCAQGKGGNDETFFGPVFVPVSGLGSGRALSLIHISPSAVIHFYNSTSVAQRQQVFKKSKDEIKKIATDGAKLVKQLAGEYEGNFRFEYSPESFTGTEPEYALEVCNAVLDVMRPTPETVSYTHLDVYKRQTRKSRRPPPSTRPPRPACPACGLSLIHI